MSTVLLNRTPNWPPVPHMHPWMRVPGSQDTKRHKHVDVSNMNILSLHSSTTSEERETDLLVLSSYSSYSCCDCWAEKRPLRPFAAAPQRSRCHPGHSWGFAGEDKSWGLAWRICHYETVKGAVSYNDMVMASLEKKPQKNAHHILLNALGQLFMWLSVILSGGSSICIQIQIHPCD